MNIAWLYNPKTKSKNYFVESDENESSLCIENFEKTKKFKFKNSEKSDVKSLELISTDEYSTSNESYINWVELIKSKITEKQISKAIAAQKQVFNFEIKNINLNVIFEELITQFSETFVYLFYIENCVWIGASPEIIGILNGPKFSTISLAGTQINQAFTDKEKQEQLIVSYYMQDVLTQNSSKLDTIPTKTLQFGAIQHLVNEYEIEINDSFDFDTIIQKIHPSPALAGNPKQKSIEIILENEELNREFYCGLVSHKISKNEAYSFAAIRCAKITKNQIAYYAGAGITSESIAEKEWEETMNKINVLKCISLSKDI